MRYLVLIVLISSSFFLLSHQDVSQIELYKLAAQEDFFIKKAQEISIRGKNSMILSRYKIYGISSFKSLKNYLKALEQNNIILGNSFKLKVNKNGTLDCFFILDKLP